jgi:DNA-binding PadR family transcriptional regulator
LIEAVAELSAGRVRLKPGSLYGALDRLAREGLVRESGSEVVAGRQRQYYELTDGGAEVLSAQVERLQGLAAAAATGLQQHRRLRRRVEHPAAAEPVWAGGQA